MSLLDQLGSLAAGALGGDAGQQGEPAVHPGMLNALLGLLQNQGGAAPAAPPSAASEIGGLLGGLLNQGGGDPAAGQPAGGAAAGLNGLLQALEQNGLGQVAASWVGNGQNLPISAEQIENVLGSEKIGQLAQQAGVPQSQASSLIAALLPSLVDHLTPSGTIQHTLLEEGVNLLRSRLA